MKLILIILVVHVFAINAIHELTFSERTQIWHRFLLQHIDVCVTETGVDRILAERLLPYGEYVDDPKLSCFVQCIGVKLNMIDKDGTTNQQQFLDILNVHEPKIRKQIISECFEQIDEEDQCAQVYKTSECVYFIVKKALTGKGKDEQIRKQQVEL